MAIVVYTDVQKAAVVSLLIEMINADGVVDPKECYVFNSICATHQIGEECYRLGLSLDSEIAIDIMKRMSDLQKIHTAQLLVKVIDADARDDDKEICLFNRICNLTGVDVLINAKDD